MIDHDVKRDAAYLSYRKAKTLVSQILQRYLTKIFPLFKSVDSCRISFENRV